jgi:capsular polysaccharide biosynthesis protein
MRSCRNVIIGVSNKGLVRARDTKGFVDNVVSYSKRGYVFQENAHIKVRDHELIHEELNKLPVIKLDETVFLLYSNNYFVNFQHLLVEFMPKIIVYTECFSNNNNIKLAVPYMCINKFTSELISLLGIKDENIIILEKGKYDIHCLYYCNYQDGFKTPFKIEQINFWKNIRKTLQDAKEPISTKRFVYLRRNESGNSDMNNNQAGCERYIINQSELDILFKKYNYENLYMATKNIKEKTEALENVDVLISEYGANLMNLLFAKNPPKIIILIGNEGWKKLDYYTTLFNIWFENKEYKTKEFIFPCKECENHRTSNVPYFVNINIIEDYIKNL